jgi:hypothetical protein
MKVGQLKNARQQNLLAISHPHIHPPPLVIDKFEVIRQSDGVVEGWFGVGGRRLPERRRDRTFCELIKTSCKNDA